MFYITDLTLPLSLNIMCHGVVLVKVYVDTHLSFCCGALMFVMKVLHLIHMLICFILLT